MAAGTLVILTSCPGDDKHTGIFASEGEEHRKLRRALAPAFSYQSVKNLAPLFLHKSFEVRSSSFVAQIYV